MTDQDAHTNPNPTENVELSASSTLDGLSDVEDGLQLTENGPESTHAMAKVPVQLTLTVGSLSLPLSQLLSMAEGQTFTHELQSFFPNVRLYAADRLVAEGELVRVDGHVGFRVTTLLG